MSEKRDSNPRPRPWQGRALPTELFSQEIESYLPAHPPRGISELQYVNVLSWSEKRDSNPRPRPWQGRALPTELFSHHVRFANSGVSRGAPCFFVCVAKVGIIFELASVSTKNFQIIFHQTPLPHRSDGFKRLIWGSFSLLGHLSKKSYISLPDLAVSPPIPIFAHRDSIDSL